MHTVQPATDIGQKNCTVQMTFVVDVLAAQRPESIADLLDIAMSIEDATTLKVSGIEVSRWPITSAQSSIGARTATMNTPAGVITSRRSASQAR